MEFRWYKFYSEYYIRFRDIDGELIVIVEKCRNSAGLYNRAPLKEFLENNYYCNISVDDEGGFLDVVFDDNSWIAFLLKVI